MTTGNGFGFQVFDGSQGKLVEFLEHPYRYLHPGATLMDAGVERRNLVYDLYFGARVGTTAGWMKDQPVTLVEQLDQTGIIHSSGVVGGATIDSYFFSPFGYAGNGMVALVKVTNTSSTSQPVSVFLNPNFHMGTATDPEAPGADGEVITTTTGMSTEIGPGGGAMVYLPIGGWDLADCSGTSYARVQGRRRSGRHADQWRRHRSHHRLPEESRYPRTWGERLVGRGDPVCRRRQCANGDDGVECLSAIAHR